MQLSTEEDSNLMLLYLKFYLYGPNASLPVGQPPAIQADCPLIDCMLWVSSY